MTNTTRRALVTTSVGAALLLLFFGSGLTGGPIFNASITDNVTPDGASGMWFSALIAIALGAVLCSAMLGRKRKGRDSVR